MKYHVLSDLHLEFFNDPIKASILLLSWAKPADCLVLAGDIVLLKHWEHFAKILKPMVDEYPKTIFVPGNHEYYGSSFPEGAQLLRKFEAAFGGKMTALYNQSTMVGDQKVVGTPLWIPETPESIAMGPTSGIADYSQVVGFKSNVHKEYDKAVKFLTKEKDYDIVVTHFVPHKAGIAEQYRGHPLNWFFMCDQSPLIYLKKPKVWLAGHTHSAADELVGWTRLVINPFGYNDEQGKNGFRKDLIVDV